MEQILQRLASANIQLLPTVELTQHFVFERDGFIALVERRETGFGNIGAPGILSEKGMAQLVWRGETAFFIARGFERPAAPEEVEKLRSFAADLKNSLTA
ncbi:hypothetical protein [Bryobacter aggregatus]|uniref:hypothetical protein n=1 Tax=Bryobacter aggregatus TaxID=360054 RepID=UPI0004E1D9ED|nr:hypothetical protein [Bryobacter aggregatus]